MSQNDKNIDTLMKTKVIGPSMPKRAPSPVFEVAAASAPVPVGVGAPEAGMLPPPPPAAVVEAFSAFQGTGVMVLIYPL